MRRLILYIFTHRTLALLRWDLHLVWIRFRNWILFEKRGLLRKIADAGRPIYLNLGSGPRGLADSHWINVDCYADTNVHYLMDFNRKWPFPDNCFDGIFCEHVFEHFDYEQGQVLLRECWRVLGVGGCLRIIVPDGAKIMRTFFENPGEFPSWRTRGTSCPMEAVNSYFRQRYEHQCMYDWQLLAHQLRRVGYTQIAQASFQQGTVSRAILLDDQKYEWESLYVEAIKPV